RRAGGGRRGGAARARRPRAERVARPRGAARPPPPPPPAPPTVYRALDFLMANGFVHKLESVNAFVACHHPNSAQHSVPFLICDRCHSAVELEDRDVVSQLEARAKALGFQPQAQTLEVHGLCAKCAVAE
ncbi:transcriptional repressor, partial [Xanthomonas euvesicatoria]|uniref:transcriptional repressor n=1 Tax=Xanthomonas euvesicatoria TaxID=456327 RepID=UPI0026E1659D